MTPVSQTPSREHAVTTGLVIALALQNAVPPFATDMYSPAFPQVATDLGASAAAVGLTLTVFFIGMAAGQVLGGAVSDQVGRRRPVLAGGAVCALGAVVCALAPSITVLMVGRVLQGLGGGCAAAVGRAVLVDVAHGPRLASVMSVLMAVGALAPMIAPVAGGAVLSVATWRAVFWCLVGFGVVMMLAAALLIPETLPAASRHGGGVARFVSGARGLATHRVFVGYMVTSAFSGFAMFAYISDSSFVLQEMHGLSPMAFSVFFAATAACQMVVSVLNARLVVHHSPRRLIGCGLTGSALGAVTVATAVLAGLPVVVLCAGFVLVMASQGLVFANASSLALSAVPGAAGVASAFLGVAQAGANAVSAPLASSGGGTSALPMVLVMAVGVVGAWCSYLLVGRASQGRARRAGSSRPRLPGGGPA